MIAKITFFPLGNADSTLITLPKSNKSILWDYAHEKDPNDKDDKRCDLPTELNLAVDGDFDVVCFTHGDKDHYNRFSEYFYLEHAKKYQEGDRKRIKEMWVPAAVLLDTEMVDEGLILRAEARHRLKSKSGILIFSRPDKMKDWCDKQEDIAYDEVKHLFIDAGKVVPSIDIIEDGVEFFVHSPFASETEKIDRNAEAIIVQATFNDRCQTKFILGSDGTTELWQDIVNVTKHFGNEIRLEWDIFHISHHSSYLSLNTNGNRGEEETKPVEEVKWLFEDRGHTRGLMVSPSKNIPSKGSKDDNEQPPHRQAANYYKRVANLKFGEYKVTMEHPTIDSPEPLVIEIDENNCATLKKAPRSSAVFIGRSAAPRAGI